jgi:hypothetical protein
MTHDAGLDARLAELEARVREMEKRENEPDPVRKVLGELFPSEVREHMRAARKEQLLALRAVLDHWIDRVEPHEGATEKRERITLE